MTPSIKKHLVRVPVISMVFFAAVSVLADLPPGNAVTLDDVTGLVNLIARFLIVTSMVAAVIFIVLSGIMTMMAQADPKRFTAGMLRLKHAAIGAGVVLATGVIINTIGAVVDRTFFCQISIIGICLY